MRNLHRIKFLALTVIILLLLSCRPVEPVQLSIDNWPVEVSVSSRNASVETAIQEATDRVQAVVNSLKPLEGQILGTLNASDTGELIGMGEVSDILTNCLAYTEQCYGAFDPTLQILWDVYDFDFGGRFVSDSELREALQFVDHNMLEIDNGSILRKGENIRMGFGPTIGGVIVDLLHDELNKEQLEWELVRVGHNVGYAGGEDGNNGYTYDFNYPLDKVTGDSLQLNFGHIRLAPGEFLSAIDKDEKFFFARGNYYHQLISPVDGRPVEELRAALVVSDESCMQASIFAYAVMIMGEERGIEFLDETEGIEGLVLTEDHDVIVSGGLGERFWR